MRLTGFDDRTALVTGATGGIRQAITRSLFEAGAYVIDTDTLAALAASPLSQGTICRPLDVRDATAAEALATETKTRHGPLTRASMPPAC